MTMGNILLNCILIWNKGFLGLEKQIMEDYLCSLHASNNSRLARAGLYTPHGQNLVRVATA